MLKIFKRNIIAQITLFVYAALLIFWLFINFTSLSQNGDIREFYSAIYGILALWGGIIGIYISLKWGGVKSLLGSAILMFSLGLLAQEFGQLTYSYYVYVLSFDKNQVPYPSIGDIGYFGSILFYIYGVILLGKISGIEYRLRTIKWQIISLMIGAFVLFSSYYIFLKDHVYDWSLPLNIFLDLGYPFGEAIYLVLAVFVYMLSKKILGGFMKDKILFLLFALVFQYIADFDFLYEVSRGIWIIGGRNDLAYLTAYFVMTLAIIQLDTALKELRVNNN